MDKKQSSYKEMLEIESKYESAKDLSNCYKMLLSKRIGQIIPTGDTSLIAKLEEELKIAAKLYQNLSDIENQNKILIEYPSKCNELHEKLAVKETNKERENTLNMESLENNLPFYLWNTIQFVKQGFCLDCSTAELEVDLRDALKCHEITKVQKEYLEKKYFKKASKEELILWFEEVFNI